MNILMHIDCLGSGGAQRQMTVLGRALAERGHTVAFNTYYAHDHFLPPLEKAGIQVRTKTKTNRFSVKPIWNLIAHARDMRADVIVSFLRTPSAYAEVAGCFLPRTKVLVSERSCYPNTGLSLSLRFKETMHRLADRITVNSSHQAREMEREFPWMARKLCIILNGLDLSPVLDRRPNTGGPLRLLTLASIAPGKDPLSLARALEVCRTKHAINVHVDWAGKAVCSETVAETDRFLSDHALTECWTWLGEKSETVALFADCDALIHTSRFEGFSNSIAEAMALGTPVLIGRTGDQTEIIEESRAGLLFEPGNPESIAEAIARFHGLSEEKRRAMGLGGRNYAEERLAVGRMVDAYEELFTEMIKER